MMFDLLIVELALWQIGVIAALCFYAFVGWQILKVRSND